MIHQLTDSSHLPYVGQQGDVAIVDDGNYKRIYHWVLGTWRHEHEYVCPVKDSDANYEPNV